MSRLEYDYVVVGSGSAGSVVAARLAEGGRHSVFVAEAGPTDRSPLISIPLAWGWVFRRRLFDWDYWSEPEAALNGRRIECARGRVVGGSSSVNGMVYARGIPADYDRWATAWGLSGWSYQDVLPYFMRSESWPHGPALVRGDHGPVHVSQITDPDPLVRSFMEAVRDSGLDVVRDYNDGCLAGFGPVQATIHKGRRWNAADAYLRPALRRHGVHLRTGILVTRVLVESGRANGIEFVSRGQKTVVHARREVILSAGVFNSPKLLMLSGVGPGAELRRHGIAVQADLKGVGSNLHDHLACEVRWSRRDAGILHSAMRADKAALAVARAFAFGTGVASRMPLGAIGLAHADTSAGVPDAQLLLSTAPLTASAYLAPFVRPYADAFTVKGMVVRPRSRGTVRLRSADPRDAPMIELRLLSDQDDLRTARSILRLIRDVGSRSSLRRHIGLELMPGPAQTSDEALDGYLRETASTLHHPVGTCRMGRIDDDGAVLDERMRVRGVQGLRVVDASAMPEVVSGPINGPVMMMAEKVAAEMCLAD